MTLIQLAGFASPFAIAFIGMLLIIQTDARKQQAYNEWADQATELDTTVVITNEDTGQTMRVRLSLTNRLDQVEDKYLVQDRLDALFGARVWDFWIARTTDGTWITSSEI